MPLFNPTDIGSTIARIRIAKQLSQDSFSAADCSQSMLSKIEHGMTSPTITKLLAILKLMNMSLAEFEFMLFEQQQTRTTRLQKQLEQTIDAYNYFLLPTYFERQLNRDSVPLLDEFIFWSNFCFHTPTFVTFTKRPEHLYMARLLNQDEFFDTDFKKLMYGLPTLEVEAAFYTYNRIQDQLQQHHIGVNQPYITIDTILTMASIYYEIRDFANAYHYYYYALLQAKKIENINRIIICNLILHFMSKNPIFLQEAQMLKSYFSKDNFYDYWYNVLYNKFNEV